MKPCKTTLVTKAQNITKGALECLGKPPCIFSHSLALFFLFGEIALDPESLNHILKKNMMKCLAGLP